MRREAAWAYGVCGMLLGGCVDRAPAAGYPEASCPKQAEAASDSSAAPSSAAPSSAADPVAPPVYLPAVIAALPPAAPGAPPPGSALSTAASAEPAPIPALEQPQSRPGTLVPTRPELTLPASLGHAQLDTRDAGFRLRVPDESLRCGPVTSTLRICVSEAGTVSSVQTLRSSLPELDLRLMEAMGHWRYRPYLLDGRPIAFCYRLLFNLG